MKIEKAIACSGTTNEAKRNIVASIEFAVRASLHEEYVDADFVHSILGKISAKYEDQGDEENAGYIKATLVQFGEAMDHGISTERLGDGIDGNIAEYWELLFDLDTGCWKEEVLNEYEASGCDLLIVDCMEISPKFRGTQLGQIAIERTIDIFGPVCGRKSTTRSSSSTSALLDLLSAWLPTRLEQSRKGGSHIDENQRPQYSHEKGQRQPARGH